MHFSTFRIPFRAVAAAGLLIAAMTLTPESASASCGSYVTILGQVDKAHPSTTTPEQKPAIPQQRCYGPNCSESPAPTGLPSNIPEVMPSDLKHLSANADDTAPLRPEWLDSIGSDDKPSHLSFAIFHPPRDL